MFFLTTVGQRLSREYCWLESYGIASILMIRSDSKFHLMHNLRLFYFPQLMKALLQEMELNCHTSLAKNKNTDLMGSTEETNDQVC